MDILIDNNSLSFLGGELVFTEGTEEIRQHINTALHTFYGDWILDNTKGINYPEGFKNTNLLENDTKSQILGVKGVISIEKFSLNFDKLTKSISIRATIKTNYGEINLQENIQN